MFCWHCAAVLPHQPPVVCESCRTPHWRDPKPCASALVTLDGRLMLVRRARDPWRDFWDVPGGFCDPHEHPMDTAQREVREETGLEVAVVGLLGMWMDTYEGVANDSPPKTTLNIYFTGEPRGDMTARPDPDEVAELRWFGPDELPAKLAFPGHIPSVLAAWRLAYAVGGLYTPLYDRPVTLR